MTSFSTGNMQLRDSLRQSPLCVSRREELGSIIVALAAASELYEKLPSGRSRTIQIVSQDDLELDRAIDLCGSIAAFASGAVGQFLAIPRCT